MITDCAANVNVSGCEDFVPRCTDYGSQFATTTFENFGDVVSRASLWIRDQCGSIRITNIQSIDYKLQHGWGTVLKSLCI